MSRRQLIAHGFRIPITILFRAALLHIDSMNTLKPDEHPLISPLHHENIPSACRNAISPAPLS